jgi:hypothetical protein
MTLTPSEPEQARLLAVGALLLDDSRVWNRVQQFGHLDTAIVDAVLELCSPVEACAFLGDVALATRIAPAHFARLCNDVYSNTQDTRALRDLALAVCKHHDLYGVVVSPESLATLLLASADYTCRVVGLKLLRRMSPGEEPFVRQCLSALSSSYAEERLGATHELLEFYRPRSTSSLPLELTKALGDSVVSTRDGDLCRSVRENATHLYDDLKALGVV